MNERADTEQIKIELAATIVRLLADRALTDAAASQQIGIAVADIVLIRQGNASGLSVDRLIEILNALNHRFEVKSARWPPAIPTRHS